MTKLIKTWNELDKLQNDKYKITVDKELYGAWIIPIGDEPTERGEDFICHCTGDMRDKNYFDHHRYLSTHTFYGSQYEYSTQLLQKYGFDIEIDNWDKKVK